MAYKILNITFLIYLLMSCESKNKSDVILNKLSIQLETGFVNVNPDSIYKSVKYIPLETKNESLIYGIDKIIFANNSYYILDKKQAVIYTFDEEGKYINKLSKRGNGPEEYITLEDFFVTPDSLIYVLSSGNRQIKIYNTQFEYKEAFKTETFCHQMDYLNNDIYLYCNFYSDDLNNIYVIDRLSGKIKNKYRNFKRKQFGVGYSNRVFSKNKNEIYALFPFDFNIYTLNENNYEKLEYIDFNGDQVPESFLEFSDVEREDYIKKHYSNMCEIPISKIENFYISEDLICFRFVRNCLEHTFLLDRINGTTNAGYIMSTKKFPLANSSFLSVIDDQIVMSSLAENVLNTYYNNKSENIKINIPNNLINNLLIDDNPILSIYQLN